MMVAERHLDVPCGKHLKYRELIECGKTWQERALLGEPIDNRPRDAATWRALLRLCQEVLDPVIDRFGSVELRYGFAGPVLARQVRRGAGGIAPALDQHAAYERNARGRRVCERGGAAVDFLVPHESSCVVAHWLAANTRFDRLVFYGDDRPVHVSVSESPLGQIVVMWRGPSGRLIPRRVASLEELPTR